MRSPVLILVLFYLVPAFGQDTIQRKSKPDYRKKEEIIFDNKRYRLYNNYVTIGGGASLSSIRNGQQRTAGADFHFHVRRQYFQAGALLSGFQFFANNHLQLHAGYGYRKEGYTYNLGLFGGPSFYQGVEGIAGQPEKFYGGVGLYLSAQAIQKITYDIGAGAEIFADLGFRHGKSGREQALYGVKVVVFFSGSYRGPKRNYNPNVRSENPNG